MKVQTQKFPEAKTIRRSKAAGTEIHIDKENDDKPSKIPLAERINAADTIADRIAKDKTIIYRNWVYSDSKKFFPDEPTMQWVDKYYPYAVGGPLLVDEPQMHWEIERCKLKRPILRGLGYRYVFIAPKMTYDDALLQMEGK